MGFDGVPADVKNLADPFVAPSVRHILKDLNLSFWKLGMKDYASSDQ
jgi:hypothetical protein